MIITRMRMRTGGGVPVHAACAVAAADKSGYDPTNEKRGKMPRFGFGTDDYAVELSYINPEFD